MKSPDWHVISIRLWKLTVDVLPWTCLSEGRWLSRQTGGQSKHYKWFCVWEDLRCWGAWDLSVGTRLRTSHYWSDWCLEERDVERHKHSTIFLERMRKSHWPHYQSDEQWNCFKRKILGEISQTWAFPPSTKVTIYNWTKLNQMLSSFSQTQA